MFIKYLIIFYGFHWLDSKLAALHKRISAIDIRRALEVNKKLKTSVHYHYFEILFKITQKIKIGWI